ncbi:hypothetical protein [Mycolicibacter virginiensis]|uniref:hypothetical protein n=1 Tax=Mycolicibacter virginiensis TaxID=1795032 RepID=UPI0010571B30|nr:hypothetical protein [Mycolicibacter virginiensis]
MRKVVIAAAIAVGACVVGTACQAPTKTDESAPTNALTVPTTSISTAMPAPTMPVEVSGSGDTVKTVDLERGGYTVEYTNSTGYLIVNPVNRDGSTGSAIINANDNSGVTTYASNGPVTLKFRNGGDWTLHFVPLS